MYFLTNGGNELYYDVRRNSLEEALKHSMDSGLQGIVSEVKAIFRNPGAVTKIKESKLSLVTYGKLKYVSSYIHFSAFVAGCDFPGTNVRCILFLFTVMFLKQFTCNI